MSLDVETNIYIFFKFGRFHPLFLEILFLLFLYSSRIPIIHMLMVSYKSQKLSSKSWLRGCICILGHTFKCQAEVENSSLVHPFYLCWTSRLMRCGSTKHVQKLGHAHSHMPMCGLYSQECIRGFEARIDMFTKFFF